MVKFRVLLLLPLLFGAMFSPGQPRADEARRIISLAPHITEMLFAIGAGAQVIAVDDASDYPKAAHSLPRVANYRSLNMEQILALQPDLIVAWGTAQQQMVQPLEQLGVAVFYSAPQTFLELGDELQQLGELTGHQRQAAEVVSDYQRQLHELERDYRDAGPVTVFYQIASIPLMSANGGTWMGQAVTLCGGVNIMADSPAPYPQVNAEQVLAQDPQVILADKDAELQHWRQWPALQAVSLDHLLTIDANRLHRFTPRTPAGIRQLCLQLDKVRAAE
ncbi:cobalamin-binding protein [Oceanisphaera arctica]|uniref:Cobalamin-binding protein n=1 Tax=Oceanisphaera arctica TaxID=641510 RepID=A0A2P5TKC1_9GAMM|nr:cobalamin-binding protein [Oceanisphaera arctica]PPL15577.1 cobalamin-binding protein [Oceanisphaera arctica]GHA25411.1 cobalamin-binding protein [Oceanisphaera arctica]